MADDKKEDTKEATVTHIDQAVIKKMHLKGHYLSILERFDLIRIKFVYDKLTPEEAREFVVLIKYLKEHGHNDSIKLTCKYMYDKYIEGKGI